VAKSEVPTIYNPQEITLTHDHADNVVFTLKPITELMVPLYAPTVEMTATGARVTLNQTPHLATIEAGERNADIASLSRVTRFSRRDQNPKAPLQALNSYAITPDGESAIFSITSQDDAGKYYSGLFLKRVEDDGGGIARLVDNNKRYFDANPVIAPDSNNILVFQSNRGDLNKPDIFRVSFTDNRTSGGVSRITNDQRFNYGPSYTDSNREVVYLSIEPNYPLARPQLSTVKLDGALPTQFQIMAEEVSHREHTKVYFTRIDESSGKRQIYSVEPDGRLETTIISDESFVGTSCFNPVASFTNPVRILFVSDRDKDQQGRPNNNIYMMNADGSQIQQLTSNGSDDILPQWSPTDPNVIYFLSNRGGAYNLWRLRLK
jgi:Tol biopolymer transport system component